MKGILLYFNKETWQPLLVSIMRIAIGWHFFWEGWIKVMQPDWSAKGYLMGAWGPFAPLFHSMANLTWADTPLIRSLVSEETAQNPWLLNLIDVAMPWLLLAAGLGLLLGLWTRLSTLLAMGLLTMFIVAMPSIEVVPSTNGMVWSNYYLSLDHAQWVGNHAYGTEGNYYLINKNLIEFFALACLLTFNPKRLYGFDCLFPFNQETVTQQNQTVPHQA